MKARLKAGLLVSQLWELHKTLIRKIFKDEKIFEVKKVGVLRIERRTSVLSGLRSNHLSYTPITIHYCTMKQESWVPAEL